MIFSLPPELFTGLSDCLNFFLTGAFWLWLRGRKSAKTKPWRLLMASLTASNLIGGIVHTFAFPSAVDDAVWWVLPLIMCLTVSFFCVCAEQERSEKRRDIAYRIFGIGGIVAYAVMMAASFFIENFLRIYVAYAAVCLIYAMILLAVTAIQKKKPHLFFYAAGLFIQIPGGILQAKRSFYFTLIWQMDFNTAYHLILTATVILLWIGYRIGETREG